MIDIVIVSMIGLAIVGAYSAGFKSIEYARAKISAVSLANEKMEYLRNMPYDELATQAGLIYPAGDIANEETINRGNFNFIVKTVINCVDDPFDGNADGTVTGTVADQNICDYKKAEITINRQDKEAVLAKLVSNFAGKAAETAGNTGIIKICVVDSLSSPLSGAFVEITNIEFPEMRLTGETDNTGCIIAPNLPPNLHNYYHVVVTKSGYSTDQTYDRTSQNKNEDARDLDVYAQQVTRMTLSIDILGEMAVSVKDIAGSPLAGLEMQVYGEKLKWTNPETAKFLEKYTTDSAGVFTIDNLEFDSYFFAPTDTGYYVKNVIPYQPVELTAGESQAVEVILTTSSSDIRLASISPETAVLGEIAIIDVAGNNLSNLSVVKLIKDSAEIIGTVVWSNSGEAQLSFDLGSASAGFYSLYLEGSGGNLTQPNGLEVISQ